MPLTVRSNGPAGGLVSAQWWNDYHDLLRGVMLDQPVLLANTLTLQSPANDAASGSLTLAAVSGTGLGVGQYYYCFTFLTGDGGESGASGSALVTTTAGSPGNQRVQISAIPTGPAGIINGRNIYRSKVGGGTMFYLTTINDNSTTTYLDSTPDGSLGTGSWSPTYSSMGSLMFRDYFGNIQSWIASGGSGSGQIVINATSGVVLQDLRGHTYLQFGDGYMVVPQWFGVKNQAGTKLYEAITNGNFIISGTQYQTSAGSISTVTGQSFNSFDVGEVFECDQVHPNGTVLCPGPDSKLVQCTHDNCAFAMIVSHNPGLGLGAPDPDQNHNYIALSGRVNIRCAQDLLPRTLVVSDGRGGVRAVRPNEPAFVLGFTLNETSVIDKSPQVGVFLRSMFVILKGH